MRGTKLLVVVALVGAAAGCDRQVALDGLADGGAATVQGVVDGDGVTLADGRSVRLAGIDAPAVGEPFGAEARAALQRQAGGRKVRLLYDGPPGDRAHLRDAGSRAWIEARLLEAGAARVRTSAESRALAKEMLKLEEGARRRGAGLWAVPAYEVRLPREVVARRESGFLIVEGRVLRVARQARATYLEFSPDWRGGFSAELPVAATGAFEAAGVEPAGLQGRLIRVRGEVRNTYYGPRLVLDHPEQIEFLLETDRR